MARGVVTDRKGQMVTSLGRHGRPIAKKPEPDRLPQGRCAGKRLRACDRKSDK